MRFPDKNVKKNVSIFGLGEFESKKPGNKTSRCHMFFLYFFRLEKSEATINTFGGRQSLA